MHRVLSHISRCIAAPVGRRRTEPSRVCLLEKKSDQERENSTVHEQILPQLRSRFKRGSVQGE